MPSHQVPDPSTPDRSGKRGLAVSPASDAAAPVRRHDGSQLDGSELEDVLLGLLEQPNLAASVVPEGFKPSKRQLLDALIAARARQRAAEVEQVALISGLCDAYACLEPNPAGDIETSARVLFGEHLVAPSIDGVPAIAEFFGHELGPALGVSADSAWGLVWDVLALRHRHPILWEHTLSGRVEVWRARKVAAACAGLPADLARRLDSEVAPLLPGWGPVKTMTEVYAVRARLDPDAETKRQQAKRSRRVGFTPHEDADGLTHGLTRVDALLDALDAHQLSGTLDELAAVLHKGGADGTIDELRAVALGQLAHPDRAARLLQPDLLDGAAVTSAGHIVHTGSGEIVTERDRQARCRHGAQVVVHMSSRDLAEQGGADIEGIGPITRTHLEELLAGCAGPVRVRPVVDLAGPMSVATYRPSPEMVWRVKMRDGREMFPYSQRSTRSSRVDLDHTTPWRDGDVTTLDNLGPNSRRTHRSQTHGRFRATQESAGLFRWTTPLGKTYWTSCHGTFTSPPPDVMSNEPCHTTTVMLAALLKAAATQTAPANNRGIGQPSRPRARAGGRTSAARAETAAPPALPDDDPWQPSLNHQPPPF